MKLSRVPQQIIPLIFIFTLAIVALVVARQMLVPESFGKYGHYRADAVDEVAAHGISYAGYQVCYDCHDDIMEIKQDSYHKGLSCEVCHGPAANHAEAPDEFTPGAPRGRGYCPLCHGYNPSRPIGFPQILPNMHNPGKACMTCHNPHAPTLPHAPEECSACHREIASTKMVSHHTTVECRTCHEVPKDHWKDPRSVHAEKPTDRSTCGQCHATGADSPKVIPRVDIETHGGRYLCWDCHYPHHPEATL